MRHILLFSCCIAAFAMACEPPAEEAGAQKTKREEIKAERIIIEYNYPGDQGFRSLRYALAKFDTGYEFDGEAVDPEKVKKLLNSLDHLIPADQRFTCRYAETLPSFRVILPHEGKKVELHATSQCQNWAPWTVIKDGKAYVQVNGAIGRALLPLLVDLGADKWRGKEPKTTGIIDLIDGLELYQGQEGQTPPKETFSAIVQALPELKKAFPGAAVKIQRLLCDQGQSAECQQLLVFAQVAVKENVYYGISAEIDGQNVKAINFPGDLEPINALVNSKLAAELKSFADPTILIEYDASADCDAVRAAAPTYKPGEDVEALDCTRFIMSAEVAATAEVFPPRIAYYPAVGAAWLVLAPDDKTDLAYFEALGVDDKVQEEIAAGAPAFANLEGVVTILN